MDKKIACLLFAILTASFFNLRIFAQPFQRVPYLVIGGPRDGVHFQTRLTLLSHRRPIDQGRAIPVRVTLFDDSGAPVSALFNGEGPVSVFEAGIGDSLTITSSGPAPQNLQAQVSFDSVFIASLVVSVQIQVFERDVLLTEVNEKGFLPAAFQVNPHMPTVAPPLRGAAIPFDSRAGKDVGLVVLNPTQGEAQLRLSSSILGGQSFTLGPGRRLIGMATELFKQSMDLVKDKVGTVEVRSDRPILIVAIEVAWPKMRSLPVFPLLRADRIFVMGETPGFEPLLASDGLNTLQEPAPNLKEAVKMAKTLLGEKGSLYTGPTVTIETFGLFRPSTQPFPIVIDEFAVGQIVIRGAKFEGGADFEGTNAALVVDSFEVTVGSMSIRAHV